MNSNDKEDNLLDWNKVDISKFAKYLYNLAKEKAEAEVETQKPLADVKQEIVAEESLKVESQKPIVESEEKAKEGKKEREKTLEEVTIGLAKAVSGEDLEDEITDNNIIEIQEIIKQKQIPLPKEDVDDKDLEVLKPEIKEELEKKKSFDTQIEYEIDETKFQTTDGQITDVEEDTDYSDVQIDEHLENLETVDLSQTIVTDPIINQEVLIKPENIPEDVHELVFVDQVTSVPITKEEIPSIEISEPVVEPEAEPVVEPEPEPVVEPEPEPVVEPEAEISKEKVRVEGLTQEQLEKRDAIIQQMLAETQKREEEVGITQRELGETEGKSYSAVVFGQESSRNLKKWKRIEKARLREEKRRARKARKAEKRRARKAKKRKKKKKKDD